MLKWVTILFMAILAAVPVCAFASKGTTLVIQRSGTMSWDEIVALDDKQPSPAQTESRVIPYFPVPPPREVVVKGDRPPLPSQFFEESTQTIPAEPDATLGPPLLLSFLALGDNNTSIPPDTHGSVGPKHVMTMLNTQVRIQNRAGGLVSNSSLNAFWSASGFSDIFDPRIIYDPGSGRWMATCDAQRQSASSSVLFAISSTSDPTGVWTFYTIDADPPNVNWCDFPDIGVNSTWIAITNNMFTIAGNSFSGAGMWVIDKSTALAGGPLTLTTFSPGFDGYPGVTGWGHSLRICLTFGPESKLYIVDNTGWSFSGTFAIRISEITGTGPAPVWSATPGSTLPGPGLFSVTNNFFYGQINAPQLGDVGLVRTNDPRMLNSVFRNGRIWCTHSAGLPIGGPVDRTAVFWYQLDPLAMPAPIVQSGVLDGGVGVHHFFPSIAANVVDDAMLGFSRSDATKFVEAVYTSRFSTDAPGTMDLISVLKLGEDSYIKDFGSGSIRWGDYSATAVDPANDICLWTIQEYAAMDVGPNPSNDRWGTWWGMICTCVAIPGDANASGGLGLDDVIRLANYNFDKPGFPVCVSNNKICWLSDLLCRGNWNGDLTVNLADVVRAANYVFAKPGGPWGPVFDGVCCLPVP